MSDQFDLAQLMYEQPAADVTPLSLADINELLETMFANARNEPSMLYVSIETVRRVRHIGHVAALYRACPRTRHKIRKCHMRRLQARWDKGHRRIRKIEQAEIAREEAQMQRMREGQQG
jgi:hypothetical protein